MYIYNGNVNVDLQFCHFINCKAYHTVPPRNGGGAIYVEHNLVTVNVYGSIFTGNTADSGHGGDVFRNPSEYNSEGATAYPVFTFHNTCPSPYSAISPVMLEEGVDVYSYEVCKKQQEFSIASLANSITRSLRISIITSVMRTIGYVHPRGAQR